MDVTVIRSRRKTLALQMKADGTIVVRAPMLIPKWEIRRFIESHESWIQNQLARLERQRELYPSAAPYTEDELKELAASARKDLTNRCAFWAERIGVSYGRISIRHQKSRWGSCSSKGNLNFNCLLMLAPEFVRDYVVVHELCHRRYMNHSPAFWHTVEQTFPEWRNAKNWLRQNGDFLMMRNP